MKVAYKGLRFMPHCGYSVDMAETPIRRVRVADEIWDPADEAAKRNGENLSVVIRRALISYARENQASINLDQKENQS